MDTDSLRLPSQEHPKLRVNEVHVWRIPLILSASRINELHSLLSIDERERAKRIRKGDDQNRFIAGRSLLRTILGVYLNIQPDQLQFRYNAYGKPFLDKSNGERGIHFNISHSGNIGLLGIVLGRQVGVDIENIRPLPDADQLVEDYFCTQEKTKYFKSFPNKRTKIFYQYWTRKEAFIKAKGRGMSIPLDCFDVSNIATNSGAQIFEKSEEITSWSVYELEPERDYVAAIMAEGRGLRFLYRSWMDYDISIEG